MGLRHLLKQVTASYDIQKKFYNHLKSTKLFFRHLRKVVLTISALTRRPDGKKKISELQKMYTFVGDIFQT